MGGLREAGGVEEGRSRLEGGVRPAPCLGVWAGPTHGGSCGFQAGFRAPGWRPMERRGQRVSLKGPVVEAAEESRGHLRSRVGRVGWEGAMWPGSNVEEQGLAARGWAGAWGAGLPHWAQQARTPGSVRSARDMGPGPRWVLSALGRGCELAEK